MKPLAQFILLSYLIFLSQSYAFGQDAHKNAWFRASVLAPVSKKWQAELELQYRSQSDASGGQPFQFPLLNSTRLWAHYAPHQNLRFSVSPLACLIHKPIVLASEDAQKPTKKEMRSAVAVELEHRFNRRFTIANRTGFEYRSFIQHSGTNALRFREKLLLKLDLVPHLKLILSDEILMNYRHTESGISFDHNRLSGILSWQTTSRLKLETGYIHGTRSMNPDHDLIEEHNFVLQAAYTLEKRHISTHK